MTDIDNIFNLFDENDKNQEIQEDQDNIFLDFRNHPVYKILMFKKMILNHLKNREIVISILKKSDPSLNKEFALNVGDSLCYNKSMDYLLELDLNNKNVITSIIEQSTEELNFTLNKAMDYFLELEEYEKCAVIKKIQDIVKENLT